MPTPRRAPTSDAFGTTSDDLLSLFGQSGEVTSDQVVTDRETGRSRGFAFVGVASGGNVTIRATNTAELQGRRRANPAGAPGASRSAARGYAGVTPAGPKEPAG